MIEKMTKPTQNRANGRDAQGRFVVGNAGGPGNPHVRKTARLRATLLNAVTERDLQAVVRALVDKALSGDVAAIKELLDRVIGRACDKTGLPDSVGLSNIRELVIRAVAIGVKLDDAKPADVQRLVDELPVEV